MEKVLEAIYGNAPAELGGVWKVVGQMVGRLDNPWLAACPDPDGSGEVREAFTPGQEAAVLAAAHL